METSGFQARAGDARRSAPAALRNRDAILRELPRLAPASGRALEIASGSGEHVVRFAAAMPGLAWHPTDPDPDQRASIAAWVAAEGPANVRPPTHLDVAEAAWRALDGIGHVLAPGGVAILYGPFLRDGETTSPGDAAFHARLRADDPRAGYKDAAEVAARLADAGLSHVETVQMPANNLLLAFERA